VELRLLLTAAAAVVLVEWGTALWATVDWASHLL
jgi:hypothetical protein